MIGDVAAAIDLVEFHAALGEERVGGEDVGAVGVATESENGRVLEEQKCVGDEVLLAGGDDLLLDREGFCVWNAAEMNEIDVHAF